MVHLEVAQERVLKAALRAGRKPEEISIMAVTKTHPWETVVEAYEKGIRVFGENRVQEAREKYRTLLPGMELHLIGHLQSNKAKFVPSLFDWVDSLDRLSIAVELNKRLSAIGKPLPVLLELNTSGESAKTGYPTFEALLRDMEGILSCEFLRVRGLMTVGPLTSDPAAIRSSFRSLKRAFEELRRRFPELSLDTLSMGMSNDFEIAIEEGATLVRLGTILFGERGGG